MARNKVQVWLVKSGSVSRLIRGTLKDVERKLREEVSIEPCSAEAAHAMGDVEIEDAGE